MPDIEEETIPPKIAEECNYVNEYCRAKHRSVVGCSWTQTKGRILMAQSAFKQGDVIFREPPLHIVAESKGNTAFDRLKELCKEHSQVFEYEPLWYWTALCSLKKQQLPPSETRLSAIDDDQQRKLLLLYAQDVKQASDASAMLVDELGLVSCLTPLELERLVQVWILNCFEHSDNPLGYSVYFMSSFMSHSCLPNAVWHHDGDDFVLRARCVIEEGDEISLSYLSEDSLLESIPARRKHLRDSKHFLCSCMRCTAPCDKSRGFRCPKCHQASFYRLQAKAAGGNLLSSGDITGASCSNCQHCLSTSEANFLAAEERELESKLDDFERRIERGRGRHSSLVQQLEASLIRAECSLCQHWLLDKAWAIAADLYERNGRQEDSQAATRKRIAFQEEAYPGLSGTRAWTLEAYADMLIRHSGSVVEPHVTIIDVDALRQVEPQVSQIYLEALQILRLMFGESHEYYTSVNRKAIELEHEFRKHFDKACTTDSSVSKQG